MIEMQDKLQGTSAQAEAIAARLRVARQNNTALVDYPGTMPTTLADSYHIQDVAIAGWPDTIGGWKVGRIPADKLDHFGTDRLIGPIFEASIVRANGSDNAVFDAIAGGFCAVEAEYVFELRDDADLSRTDYNTKDALALVKDLWTGIEIAGSPMAKINIWGPTAVVSDFGNNTGLILGRRLDNWRSRLANLACTLDIDYVPIGTGTVSAIPGGIEQSLVFALNCAARRGLPLKAGMFISTGAVTGVHEIDAGQSAQAHFGEDGTIYCRRQGKSTLRASLP